MKEKVTEDDLDSRYRESYEFISSDEHGAILALPEGSTLYILENQSKFRNYARMNAKEWFRYAEELRGREFPRDRDPSLYMVTGCEKCSAWGIASFFSPQPTRKLVIIPFNTAQSNESQTGNMYSWGFDGRCNTRCHPDADDSSWEGPYCQNQCVFLRGFKVSKRRKKSSVKVRDITGSRAKAESILDIGSLIASGLSTNYAMEFHPHTPSYASGSSMGGGTKPQDSGSCELSSTSDEESLELDDRTTWERPSLYHPCDVINNLMFDVSAAYHGSESVHIAISHDDDWCASDSSVSDGSNFIRQLLSRCKFVVDEDVVYTEAIQTKSEVNKEDRNIECRTSACLDSIVRLEIGAAALAPLWAGSDESTHGRDEDNEDAFTLDRSIPSSFSFSPFDYWPRMDLYDNESTTDSTSSSTGPPLPPLPFLFPDLWGNPEVTGDIPTVSEQISPVTFDGPKDINKRTYHSHQRRRKLRNPSAQLKPLERAFEQDHKPNLARRKELAAQLSLPEKSIQVWFQNRRMKEKKRASHTSSARIESSPKSRANDE
uniref:Homeobox domain-containing protein n=2 Tax=Moniliophthora roreri TaxID=221103 RepID=A0A0W0ETY2_MONRR